MANRFWVGGAGTWDTASTTHWSATDGGAAGASAPVNGDIVRFTSLSGGGTVNITTTNSMSDVSFVGFTGTVTGTLTMSAAGATAALTLGAGATFTGLAVNYNAAGSTSNTLTCNGKTLGSFNPRSFGGGTNISCLDALTVSGALLVGSTGGSSFTLSLKNGVTHTVGSFSTQAPASGANTLNSTTGGSQATLSDSSGQCLLRDLTIQDIAFTGGAEWLATTNFTDNGNCTGYFTSGGDLFDLGLF